MDQAVQTAAKALIAAALQVKTRSDTMDQTEPQDIAAQIAGAIDWWRGAGVDSDYADEATNWLPEETEQDTSDQQAVAATPQANRKPATPEPVVMLGGDKAKWPTELAGFSEWWLSEPTLDENGTFPRIAPRGTAEPELMILVAEPELDDREKLLSGPQGRMLSNMLSAMGISEDAAYIAAALPRHTPLADWQQLEASGMGAILLHQITLVRPKRLCVFGSNVLPLLGHAKAQSPAALLEINHESGSVPAMANRDIAMLLQSAGARARFWQRWTLWTEQ